MKDLTTIELQNIDGGDDSTYMWGLLAALAVATAPLDVPVVLAAVAVATIGAALIGK